MQTVQLKVGQGRWCEQTVKNIQQVGASRQQWCELGSLLRDMSPRQMRAVRQNCTKKVSEGEGAVPHKRTLCLRKIARRQNCTNALYPFYLAVTCHRGDSYCANARQIGKFLPIVVVCNIFKLSFCQYLHCHLYPTRVDEFCKLAKVGDWKNISSVLRPRKMIIGDHIQYLHPVKSV